MRLLNYFMFTLISTTPTVAQAPPSAALWDIPATTLARSAALENGVVAPFWNPAAIGRLERFAVGAQVVQTSEILRLSGVLIGVGQRLTPLLAVGAVFGRVQVADLVRTSGSPVSDPGEIPVYEQMGGIVAAVRIGPASLGALVRGHDARFDVFRESGMSADLGIQAEPVRGLVLAAATRFVPVKPEESAVARYCGGVEYRTRPSQLWSTPTAFVARYGVLGRRSGPLEHTLGAGIDLANRLRVDVSMTREGAFGQFGWRTALALGVRAGRYDILASRASGLEGVGANYRVGLEVDFDP